MLLYLIVLKLAQSWHIKRSGEKRADSVLDWLETKTESEFDLAGKCGNVFLREKNQLIQSRSL